MAWSILMMFCVLAAIPVVLWTVKRMQTIRPAGAARQLEIIAQLPLGARERVVMVRMQDRVLVLGATAAQINLLAEADASALAPAAPVGTAGKADAGFASLLLKTLSNGGVSPRKQ